MLGKQDKKLIALIRIFEDGEAEVVSRESLKRLLEWIELASMYLASGAPMIMDDEEQEPIKWLPIEAPKIRYKEKVL